MEALDGGSWRESPGGGRVGEGGGALPHYSLPAGGIEEEEPGALLNSKSEFGHNRVPRIRIKMGNTILRGERGFEEGRTREELDCWRRS